MHLILSLPVKSFGICDFFHLLFKAIHDTFDINYWRMRFQVVPRVLLKCFKMRRVQRKFKKWAIDARSAIIELCFQVFLIFWQG